MFINKHNILYKLYIFLKTYLYPFLKTTPLILKPKNKKSKFQNYKYKIKTIIKNPYIT